MTIANFHREADGLRGQIIVLMILVLALVLRSCGSEHGHSSQPQGSFSVPSQPADPVENH